MKEMHYFRLAQQEALSPPAFQGSVTYKLLLEFLCDLSEWAHAAPSLAAGVEKDAGVLYLLYRDIVFSDQDFWQTFGGYLIVLRPRWEIRAFGAELFTQEAAELSLEQQDGTFYAVQRTVSGQHADSIRSLCLRVQCPGAGEAARLRSLCQSMDWKSGVLAAGWDLRGFFDQEQIPWLHQNSCYCYGDLSGHPWPEKYLDVLRFPQKVKLWAGFLESGLDYAEFEWLYGRISGRELSGRTEWELALYAALQQLGYTLKISGTEFELCNGQGERRYFSFNSGQNAQRAFLKLLFPINL